MLSVKINKHKIQHVTKRILVCCGWDDVANQSIRGHPWPCAEFVCVCADLLYTAWSVAWSVQALLTLSPLLTPGLWACEPITVSPQSSPAAWQLAVHLSLQYFIFRGKFGNFDCGEVEPSPVPRIWAKIQRMTKSLFSGWRYASVGWWGARPRLGVDNRNVGL